MRDVDTAWAEQEGFAPGGEGGDVGGELGDHGVEAGEGAHLDEGEFEREDHLAAAGDGLHDGSLGGFGGADEADEEVGLGFVGDDVGRAAAVDEADVKGGIPDAFDDREFERPDVVERG